jgi:hypothetical protein
MSSAFWGLTGYACRKADLADSLPGTVRGRERLPVLELGPSRGPQDGLATRERTFAAARENGQTRRSRSFSAFRRIPRLRAAEVRSAAARAPERPRWPPPITPSSAPQPMSRGCNMDWRQLRAIHLADETYCRECQRRDVERRAKIVDHIISIPKRSSGASTPRTFSCSASLAINRQSKKMAASAGQGGHAKKIPKSSRTRWAAKFLRGRLVGIWVITARWPAVA